MTSRRSAGKRRFVLAATAVYCLTRAAGYAPWRESTPQEPILIGTGGGALLPVFAAAWCLAGLMALWCMRSTRIILPLSLAAGLMAAWGFMWAIGWAMRPDTLWWQTAVTYLGPAAMVAGLTILTPREPDPPIDGGDDD